MLNPIKQNFDEKRAISDMGAALMVQDESTGKYSLYMPVTDIPATGAAPDTLETTVTTSRKKTYIDARQDSPQQEYTVHKTIDNTVKLNADNGKTKNFMIVYGDGTGIRFTGSISGWVDATSVNGVVMMKLTITVASMDDQFAINVFNMIIPTVTFTNTLEDVYEITVGGKSETYPASEGIQDVTYEVESTDVTVATATLTAATAQAPAKLTVTGVKAGSTTIEITGSASGYATNKTYFNVIVGAAVTPETPETP